MLLGMPQVSGVFGTAAGAPRFPPSRSALPPRQVADMLLGTPQVSGLLPDLLPNTRLPWWITSRAPLLALVAAAIAPLLHSTSLSDTALTSAASVACSVGSCLVLVLLLGVGLARGVLPPPAWLPQPSVFGVTRLARAMGALSTVGVLMTAFVIQHQVRRGRGWRAARAAQPGHAACEGRCLCCGQQGGRRRACA